MDAKQQHAIPFTVPANIEAAIDELITHYPQKRSASLMVLHALQEHLGYLPETALEWAALKLGLEPINLYELATFYPMLRRKPMGQFQFKVCRTLSCALAGSATLHEHLCRKLGLNPDSHEPQCTPDGRFSVEYVECLAGCHTAPVLMCNEDLYENVTPEKADEILGRCKKD